ncbi:hypothetical protein [Noviherbaspirillum galbum]|nr:hypothetical protein [Noviherbaspirillum galbum]
MSIAWRQSKKACPACGPAGFVSLRGVLNMDFLVVQPHITFK